MKSPSRKENQNLEWKEIWRDEYLKWVCGFANAEGGTLIIGKNDKGLTVGIENAKELLELLPNKTRDLLGILVDVNLRRSNAKESVEIVVSAYPNPISYRGEYYYRSGSTNQALRGSALDRFLLRKQGRHWDDVPMPSFKPQHCSANALKLFKQKAKQSGRMSDAVLKDGREFLFENLELVDTHGLRRAACLLFSDHPQKYFAGSWIKIGYFASNDDLRYQDEVNGNLFEQIEKAMDLLQTKYLKAYITYQGIQRVENFLYPSDALREALINAVVHKDYASAVPIQISVYEDKICLWNPGQLPDGWTMKRFLGKHPSKPHNPLLANTFFRAGYIEAWGRGIDKIKKECQELGIPKPMYDFEMSGLMITFNANPDHIKAAGSQTAGSVKTSVETRVETRAKTPVKILQLLQSHPEMTLAQVAANISKSLSAVERASSKLVKDGQLKYVGPQKGGHWEVSKKEVKDV